MDDLTTSSSYAVRRGSAFGLAGAVKGLGISALKGLGVVNTLTEALKGNSADAKEGSLFAMECLSDRLGLLFEPYIIQVHER